MYFSRFNYVSDHEEDGQRLLMNFLSRSCDIVDEESASHFSEKKNVSSEEREYALKRGYIFPDESSEKALLQELYKNELLNRKSLSVVYADTFDGGLKEIAEKVKNQTELVFYSEENLENLDIDSFNHSVRIHIITVHENLPVFDPFFKKKMASKVTLIVPVDPPFKEDTESRVDTLVEYGTPVEIIARLHKKDVKNLKQLMNYFIYKGWPFLENFTCNLEPSPNEGCIFGRWYGDEDFARAIFEMYGAHPQTEFCSVQNWVGVNTIHSLIWGGKPSYPSSHFCEASRGLTGFMGDGSELPCPHVKSGFQAENPECHFCVYALTCGGGCKVKLKANRCPPVKELIEVSLEYYFVEFLKRIDFYEQYHGGIQ
ncbi:MAG: hypothetical protein HXS44_03080 [Theionarchaea archaeon]|nr:hypothetical protein [Theionarchaea archaeon]